MISLQERGTVSKPAQADHCRVGPDVCAFISDYVPCQLLHPSRILLRPATVWPAFPKLRLGMITGEDLANLFGNKKGLSLLMSRSSFAY